ncbi:MAG: ferric reductase-like transmembrane domain-containing protein [Candidatus Moranbacteria bacterium]|nr:ferric reductase-like transmembrane domain-containing protein [Candidatus Moranbacteria bacterium]
MAFFDNIFSAQNPAMRLGFKMHDGVSDFVARYLKQLKFGLLVLAHASLLGLFFPQFARDFGEVGRNLLLVIMLVSPLSKIFRMRILYQMMSLRRELGIWFAYLAIVHGVGYILDPEWFSVFIAPFVSDPLSIMPRYIFGIIALILTLPLLITSNNLSLRLLKGNWKRVHWLTYPMFAFVLAHSFLPDSSKGMGVLFAWIQFGIVFGGYVFLKMLAKNNFLTPLREVNEYVGQQYREYQSKKQIS